MLTLKRRRAAAVAVAIALVCAALAVLAGTATPVRADESRSCAWTVQIAGDQLNALYPDQAARYWVAFTPIPPGGSMVVKGRFPYARYLSFNTYTVQTQAIDAIHDAQIRPDKGSQNPFLPGARRRAVHRDYTVRVVFAPRPTSGVPANTIYLDNPQDSKQSVLGNVAMRIYEPDRGRSRTGDVGLPSIETFAADGTPLVSYPSCPDTSVPDLGVTPAIAAAGPGRSLAATLGLPSISASKDLVWHKFVNLPTALADEVTMNDVLGSLNPALREATQTYFASGGFGENVDNKYVAALASADHGAVLVLRGKLPTYARTLQGQRRFHDAQLRYWSMCTENTASQFYACLNDDAIPLDRQRRYTIMISTAAARPNTAIASCGIAWLPAGPSPQTVLLLRNMLPDSGFAQAIQNVEPGEEKAAMGAYYPRPTYVRTTQQAVKRFGCRRPASIG